MKRARFVLAWSLIALFFLALIALTFSTLLLLISEAAMGNENALLITQILGVTVVTLLFLGAVQWAFDQVWKGGDV